MVAQQARREGPMASVYKATYTKPGPNGIRVKKRSKNYTIEYTDAHGVRRKVSSKTSDKKAATLLAALFERQAALGRVGALDPFAQGKATPLSKLLADYEDHHKQQGTAQRHRTQVLARLRGAFAASGASYSVDVTAANVEKHLGQLGKEGKGARTRNSHLASLKAFFNWCMQTKRLGENPAASLHLVKESEDKRRVRRALSADEVARLVTAAAERPVHVRRNQKVRKATRKQLEEARRTGLQRALTYKILFETGLRVGELREVTWADVDLGAVPSVRVRASVSKNGKADRIPLRPKLAEDLCAWKKETTAGKVGDKILHIAWRPADILKKDLAHAKIPYQDEQGRYADLHSLRHSLATHLATSGVAPRVSQSVLRHSSIDLTMQTYTDDTFLNKAAALAHLPDLPRLYDPPPAEPEEAA
jgi:integrase